MLTLLWGWWCPGSRGSGAGTLNKWPPLDLHFQLVRVLLPPAGDSASSKHKGKVYLSKSYSNPKYINNSITHYIIIEKALSCDLSHRAYCLNIFKLDPCLYSPRYISSHYFFKLEVDLRHTNWAWQTLKFNGIKSTHPVWKITDSLVSHKLQNSTVRHSVWILVGELKQHRIGDVKSAYNGKKGE